MKMATVCLTAVVAFGGFFLWMLPLHLLKKRRKEENGTCGQNLGYCNGQWLIINGLITDLFNTDEISYKNIFCGWTLVLYFLKRR